jgi:hypothetical protein
VQACRCRHPAPSPAIFYLDLPALVSACPRHRIWLYIPQIRYQRWWRCFPLHCCCSMPTQAWNLYSVNPGHESRGLLSQVCLFMLFKRLEYSLIFLLFLAPWTSTFQYLRRSCHWDSEGWQATPHSLVIRSFTLFDPKSMICFLCGLTVTDIWPLRQFVTCIIQRSIRCACQFASCFLYFLRFQAGVGSAM